ncbi:MAG: hypothetical protein KDC38_12435, partial [Planctomycetes bacterium]|nr:hypothetical protein [Planctomycetota bacterium]
MNIWASVGLGFLFQIRSYLHSRVAPFEGLSGGDLYSLDFALKTDIVISIPCQISVDILAGIASVGIALIPEATFELAPFFELAYSASGSTSSPPGLYRRATMDISMQAEACLQTILLGEQCVTVTSPLVTDWEFMSPSGSLPALAACATSSSAAGAGVGVISPAGSTVVSVYESVNKPVSIVSPDGTTVVDLWVTEDTQGQLAKITITENGIASTLIEAVIYDNDYFMEPSAAFVSDTEIILIGTGPPIGWMPLPTPIDPAHPLYLVNRNLNAARAEIQMVRLSKASGSWTIDMLAQSPLSDPESALPEDWRVDGRATITGDPS